MSSPVDHAELVPEGPAALPQRPWLAPVVLGGVVLAGCAAVAMSDGVAELVPPCPFRALTGLDCPLCGGTRAVRALGGGQLGTAAGYNLLVVLAIPLVALGWARWLGRELRPGAGRRAAPRWLAPTITTLALAFAVARNLDVAGLSWMASAG